MSKASWLRARLQQPEILVLPGAADAITARLVEEADFEAVYATGAGIANAMFALPDVGLTTMTEMCAAVGRISQAVRIPVLADGDTGYGGPLNVFRTVQEYERAGVAGIQLEDQVAPKRCGHFDRVKVVPVEVMRKKITAAVTAREDQNFIIIARTDARSSEGIAAAITRSLNYVEAGADLIFIEAPQSVDELERIPKVIPVPVVVNVVEGGKTPAVNIDDLEAMGFRVAILANFALRVALKAMRDALAELRRGDGALAALTGRMISWDERQVLVRLPEFEVLDHELSK